MYVCVCVAMAEIVRSGPVALVSGINIATTDYCRPAYKTCTRHM